MLIAMALTLILVYAIAQFYAIIGESVKDGRAMIEMNQHLRAAAARLKSDLDQVTVPVAPWADEGGAAGYFMVSEGRDYFNSDGSIRRRPASDWDVNGNYKPDAEPGIGEFVDFDNNGTPDGFAPDANLRVSSMLGDCDDVLAMTIRAAGIPFTGQNVKVVANSGLIDRLVMGTELFKLMNEPLTEQITAPYAEVVWWTSFTDIPAVAGANANWDLIEPRFIHRRQLLIRPDLNAVHAGDGPANGVPYFFRVQVPNIDDPTAIFIYDVHQYCDVSIRPDYDLSEAANNNFIYFKANSLADLARRENRFMHQCSYGNIAPPAFLETPHAFPYALDLNPNYSGSLNRDSSPTDLGTVQTRHKNNTGNPNQASQYRWVLFDGGRKGEDVIVSDALAFDVRVYDTEAIIRSDVRRSDRIGGTLPRNAIQPGDPGYAYANSYNITTAYEPFEVIGTGAYVDLGYGIGLASALGSLPDPHRVSAFVTAEALLFNTTPPLRPPYSPTLGESRVRFAGRPFAPQSYGVAGSNLTNYRNRIGFTWDSWTLAYERDGINQDLVTEGASPLIDEGSDGIDNDGNNGVDDAGERETVPPYVFPLRGVQIRIRLYEPATRQVRQATVEGDFISE